MLFQVNTVTLSITEWAQAHFIHSEWRTDDAFTANSVTWQFSSCWSQFHSSPTLLFRDIWLIEHFVLGSVSGRLIKRSYLAGFGKGLCLPTTLEKYCVFESRQVGLGRLNCLNRTEFHMSLFMQQLCVVLPHPGGYCYSSIIQGTIRVVCWVTIVN